MQIHSMQNPWSNLPLAPPYVLPRDRSVVDAFNARHSAAPDYTLQTHLLPEPFFGNISSRVYVLGLNPGYSPADDEWHANTEFADAIRDNHSHVCRGFPHYYLDPKFGDSPGSRWWRQKCRWLIDACGLEVVSQSLFCAELFPYHSHKYKPVPKSIASDGLVPSSIYTVHLLRAAMNAGKAVVAMRAFKAWCRLVPELANYSNLHRLNSPQNVSLSPKNLPRYDELVDAISVA
jgi:hypothetical protein